uniref:Uncharacterized protein n=1 Tax=Strombidium inclinatum TaxID=197538 RepID=A0A7S3ID22_9SPIT|mmetsp:Transcript_11713/g.17872  ORF Transcript_11713/g.17872 Transcript_11713/m.17872 type:complete len:421 (+) Transcript_11713:27-1289(+)
MNFGRGFLDKMINGAFLGKRQIGRPIKYNIRHMGDQGLVELVFNPRNKWEMTLSKTMRFIHPYLAFFTYRFHVEKARDAGIRIDDFYNNKFHKEPYIMNHVYAQNFHPTTLTERVRDTSFFRRPRMLFKGFTVPDWATAKNTCGFEYDVYSRQAWENALHEFNSEWTPMQFWGERQDPNVLNWFRLEQTGKGLGARLFYNEEPNPTWMRHGGHMDQKNKEKALWSFTHADQDQALIFGIDTTTPEGRAAFKKEWEIYHKIAPEMITKESFIFPHEMKEKVSTEPHFQRLWTYYRDHTFKTLIQEAVANGSLSQEDAAAALKFFGGNRHLSAQNYVLAKTGFRADLEESAGFQSAKTAMKAIGMVVPIDDLSAEPYEQQFWHSFEGISNMSKQGLKEAMPTLVGGSHDRAKVEAIVNEQLE